MRQLSLALSSEIRLFKGVKEFLEETRRIPKALVTNRRKPSTRKILKSNGILGFFKCMVTGDMVEKPKPSPEGLLKALKKMGVRRNEALYVGDTETDLKAGKAAGMRTIIINSRICGAENARSFKQLEKMVLES